MTSASPRLDLPMILPAQAQKHVTHNEALLRLDGAVQMVLQSISQATPPSEPFVGHSYFTSDSATGDWVNNPRMVATYTQSGWVYLQPSEGWFAWDAANERHIVYQNDAWMPVPLDLENLPAVGVNATADTTNRLIVSAQATLLTHEGNNHQLKVNKAGAGDTASLVLQSNWSGRAEIGLCGDDAVHVKVSADGGTWLDAIVVDPQTGHLTGAAVQTSAEDTTEGRLMRSDYGYCPGNVLGAVGMSNGVPSGAIIESSHSGAGSVVKFVDGTQICLGTIDVTDATSAMGALYSSAAATWTFPAQFAEPPSISVSVSGASGVWGTLGGTAPASHQAELQVLSAYSVTGSLTLHCTAIGRWI
jgi:hypothetical protein